MQPRERFRASVDAVLSKGPCSSERSIAKGRQKPQPLGAFSRRATEATKLVGRWPFPPPQSILFGMVAMGNPLPSPSLPTRLNATRLFYRKGAGRGRNTVPVFPPRHRCFHRHTPCSLPRSPQQCTVPSGTGTKWAPSRFSAQHRNKSRTQPISRLSSLCKGCPWLCIVDLPCPPRGCRALSAPDSSPLHFLFVYFKPTALPFSETGSFFSQGRR